MVAIGAMEAVKEKKLAIPRDMCISGFDDIDLANEVIPNLTTMHVKGKILGRLVMQRLLDLIKSKEMEFNKIILDPYLVVRDSTAEFVDTHSSMLFATSYTATVLPSRTKIRISQENAGRKAGHMPSAFCGTYDSFREK